MGFALTLRAAAGSFGVVDTAPRIAIAYPHRSARAQVGDSPPVLLLPGFATSSRALAPLAHYLRRELRRPVVRIALGEGTPLLMGDVQRSAHKVDDAIQDLTRRLGVRQVDVVGHSLGGLVATYLLKAIDGGRRVRRVVTLGAPHRGTPMALLGALLLGVFSRAIWQMVPGSPLLKEIERLPVPEGSNLLALEAGADAVVPLSCGRPRAAPRQAHAVVLGIGHIELLFSRRALEAVRTFLEPEPGWVGGPSIDGVGTRSTRLLRDWSSRRA